MQRDLARDDVRKDPASDNDGRARLIAARFDGKDWPFEKLIWGAVIRFVAFSGIAQSDYETPYSADDARRPNAGSGDSTVSAAGRTIALVKSSGLGA
jgi:hypothetical protein